MASLLTMPKLSDSMDEATIIRWLKSPGEPFLRGEPLAEIETDKATIVYEAESDGVLAKVVVQEGGTARLGETIAFLNGFDASPEHEPDAVAAPQAASTGGEVTGDIQSPLRAISERGGERVRATPVARRRAVELGLSLFGLEGTGPAGRVTASDVERAARSAVRREDRDRGTAEEVALTSTQATIAKRMELSSAVPVFTVTIEIDMTDVVSLRRGADELVQVVPSVNDFVVRAAGLTLRRFPAFNAAWTNGGVERYSRINIGLAVAVGDALLVPTLFDADRKTLATIASESHRLIDRARNRNLQPDDLSHSTFTVSNLGMFGVHSFTALVNSPQAAILAVGAIARRPAEIDGRIALRESMLATLSADHRVVYGADAAAFLNQLKALLEHPLALTL